MRWRLLVGEALTKAGAFIGGERSRRGRGPSGFMGGDEEVRLIADAFPTLIAYIDATERYRFVNRTYEEWFGQPREAILGRSMPEILGEAAYERIRPHVAAALAGERVRYEAFLPYQGGPGRHVEALYVPRFGADGRAIGFYALVADASEHRRVEAAARASEERLSLARQAAGIGLWDWDVETNALVWSDETYRVHGLEPGSITPSYENWFRTIHPEDRDRIAQEMAERSYTQRDPDYEFRTILPDGTIRWLISKGRLFREAGRIVRISGVIYDVTEIREAAETLRRVNETLEQRVAERTRQLEREAEQRRSVEAAFLQAQKMEAVGKLTGGVAHDFNNLLTTIIGNLELIGGAARDDERIRKLAGAAERAATRGARLTESLLAFARVRPMRRETIDVNRLLQEFSGLVHRAVGEAVSVRFELDPSTAAVHTDPAQLEAALLNLAINARDAMQDGGTLTLKTANVSLGSQNLADNPDARAGRFVEITVADTGSGIPEHVRSRVFEPFFTTKEVGKGSGLGLSQVFGFARQSGGDVRLQSAPGQGTIVRLYLPAVAAAAHPGEAATRRAALPGGGKAILLVEDDAGVRDVTAETLEALGFAVLRAADGEAALALFRQRDDIELVLADVIMSGGMSGVALARAVRALRPGLGILLISGYAEAALGTEDAEGEFELLWKPFNQAQLAERIRLVLERRSAIGVPGAAAG